MNENLINSETAELVLKLGLDPYDSDPHFPSLNMTQSTLQKWLRETHNLHVTPVPTCKAWKDKIAYYYIIGLMHRQSGFGLKQSYYPGKLDGIYSTYEECLEIGLLRALKMVEEGIYE